MLPWSENFLQKGLTWVPIWYVQNNIVFGVRAILVALDLHQLHTCYLYLLQKPMSVCQRHTYLCFPYQAPSHLGVVSTIDSSIVICLLRAMSG